MPAYRHVGVYGHSSAAGIIVIGDGFYIAATVGVAGIIHPQHGFVGIVTIPDIVSKFPGAAGRCGGIKAAGTGTETAKSFADVLSRIGIRFYTACIGMVG